MILLTVDVTPKVVSLKSNPESLNCFLIEPNVQSNLPDFSALGVDK